jgi:hypothetical protein
LVKKNDRMETIRPIAVPTGLDTAGRLVNSLHADWGVLHDKILQDSHAVENTDARIGGFRAVAA